MAVTIGLWFAGVVGVAIVLIGARFVAQPVPASASFGVPAAADDAYLSVKGVRDVASGLFLGLLLWHGQPRLVGWFMLVASLIPIADGAIVLRHHGPRSAAFGVHWATALFMLASAGLLLLG
jgi:hypothetical protein